MTITASQAGDSDYDAATNVTRTFTVGLGNFLPNSYPGLRLWLDANDINADGLSDTAADFLSGGKVNTWKDRSANGFDATQSDLTKMPVYTPATQNGLTVVDFTADQMNIPDLGLAGSKDRTIFVVGKSSQGPFLTIGKDVVGKRVVFGRDPSSDKLHVSLKTPGGTFVGTGDAVSSMSISSAVLEGTTLADFTLSVNGTSESASGALTVDTLEEGANRIGSLLDGQGRLTGQIAEVLVFDSALSQIMLQKVEGYLATKWGLRGSLPGGHPYKSTDPAFGGSQTITFPAIADQTAGAGTLELSATNSSGLPVVFTSSDSTIFSISGKIGTIHKSGSVTVTASHPGDTHYTAATNQTRTFSITKENQTIVFQAPADKGKYDPDFALIATATSGLPITFTVDSGPASIKPGTPNIITLSGIGGNVTVTASQSGNDSYNAATSVSHTFNVNANEPQTITFKGPGEDGSRLRNFKLGHRPFMIPLALQVEIQEAQSN